MASVVSLSDYKRLPPRRKLEEIVDDSVALAGLDTFNCDIEDIELAKDCICTRCSHKGLTALAYKGPGERGKTVNYAVYQCPVCGEAGYLP